jgi:hypothetical protein
MLTRQEVCNAYEARHGIIKSPGKFEGEPLWVPAFWDVGLDGCPDEDAGNVWFFVVTDDDRAQFVELHDVYGVALEESDQGFVYSQTYATKADYDAAIAEVEAQDTEDTDQ